MQKIKVSLLISICILMISNTSVSAYKSDVSTSKVTVEMKSDDNVFRVDEDINFEISAKSNIIQRTVSAVSSFFGKSEGDQLTIKNNTGDIILQKEVSYKDKEPFKVDVSNKDKEPGVYKGYLNNKEFAEFYWGVLTINTDKDIYKPDENVYIQIAALDSKGRTLCDAPLSLTMGEEQFSTENQTIKKGDNCGQDNVTDNPDYFLNYKLKGINNNIKYKLKNLNNNWEIEGEINVTQNPNLVITRKSATRINPFESKYKMRIEITSQNEVETDITESVPLDFSISDDIRFKTSKNNTEQIITWQKQKVATTPLILEYEYQAPKITPDIFLIGPINLSKTNEFEKRTWQLASDADITYSTSSEFNADAVGRVHSTQVDTDKFIVCYVDGSAGKCRVATVVDDSFTWGTEAEFASDVVVAADESVGVCKLDTNKFAVVYTTDVNDDGMVRAGSINEEAITFGTAVEFSGEDAEWTNCVGISTNKIAIGYNDEGNSDTGQAIICTASENELLCGFEDEYSNSSVDYYSKWNSLTKIGDNKFAAAWRAEDASENDDGFTVVGTVSATTITFGTPAIFSSDETQHTYTCSPNDAGGNSDDKYVVVYRNMTNTAGEAKAVTVSGTTPTIGNAADFNPTSEDVMWPGCTFISDTEFVVAYEDVANSENGKSSVCTVNWSTRDITCNSDETFAALQIGSSANGTDTEQRGITTLSGYGSSPKIVVSYVEDGDGDDGMSVVGNVTLDQNNGATGYSFQRKTWYDGTRFWRSYHDPVDNRIEFEYSLDGSSWTENTSARVNANTNDFSIEADSNNAFITYSLNNDIKGRKATSYPNTSFSWGSEEVVLNGTSANNSYSYPTITKDSSNYVWVGARYYNSNAYTVATIKEDDSTNDLPDGSTDTKYEIGAINNNNANVYATLTSVGSQNVYATFVVDSEIRGCEWVNADSEWQDENGDPCQVVNWLTGWEKRIEISVEPTEILNDLTHFPLLVKLGGSVGRNFSDVTAVFDELGSNSLKIAITKDDGVSQIYGEIEKWDSLNEEAWIWVSDSSLILQEETATVLYLYYDNSKSDNTTYIGNTNSLAAENVWDSNFAAVWHFSETTGTVYDSTTNDNDSNTHSILSQGTTGASCRIAGCNEFDGDDHGIEIVENGTLDLTTNLTMQAWLDFDTWGPSSESVIIEKDYASGYAWYLSDQDTDDAMGIQSSSGVLAYSNDFSLSTNTLQLATVTYNQDIVAFFVNSNFDSLTPNTAAFDTNDSNLFIATDAGINNEYDGHIDEVRISTVDRSSEWIIADYASQTDNLIEWGVEESPIINYDSIATGVSGITTSISSITDSSNDVHLTYIDSSGQTVYKKRDTNWGSAVVLDSNSGNAFPSITIHNENGDLYVFWIRNDDIYYKKGVSPYASGNWDVSPTTWKSTGTNVYIVLATESGNRNIFGQWYDGSNVQWDKISLNSQPSIPGTPYAEGQSNPSGILDLTPEFSAIFTDPDTDNANYYEIEVNTQSNFAGTVMWDSGQTSMSNLASGDRSSDVSYGGTALTYDGTTYYWRIRFWDIYGSVSNWSETQSFSVNAKPSKPSLNNPGNAVSNQSVDLEFKIAATDVNSDYLRYKIELCEDVDMTSNCQTFDQTSSQTGWSNQNSQTNTAYTSGTQATYTIQTSLDSDTTYYWRSYAIDPAGSNTWSETQSPYSFTTGPLAIDAFNFSGLNLNGINIE